MVKCQHAVFGRLHRQDFQSKVTTDLGESVSQDISAAPAPAPRWEFLASAPQNWGERIPTVEVDPLPEPEDGPSLGIIIPAALGSVFVLLLGVACCCKLCIESNVSDEPAVCCYEFRLKEFMFESCCVCEFSLGLDRFECSFMVKYSHILYLCLNVGLCGYYKQDLVPHQSTNM